MPSTYSLTAAQRTIWFDEMLSSDEVVHTMGDHLDIRGPLDVPVLVSALRQLVDESENLRMEFAETDGLPVQILMGDPQLPVQVEDVSALGEYGYDVAIAAMKHDLEIPFDLAAPPLVRATVYLLGQDRHLLYIGMHHMVSDGYSRLPSYDRLTAIYRALVTGGDPAEGRLPPLGVLIDTESRYLASASHGLDERYWQGRAADYANPFTLSHEPPTSCRRQLRRTEILDSATAGSLRTAARNAGVSWPTFVIAATATYLAKVSGTERAQLTLPVAARVGSQTRAVPGMVANYLPIVLDSGPRNSKAELLRATASEIMRTLKHQRFRGEHVRRMAGLTVDDRRPFGPFINVLPQHPTLDFGAASAQVVNMSTGIVEDLMVTVLDGPAGSLELHVNGNPKMYEEDRIGSYVAELGSFLTSFAALDSDQLLGALPVAENDGLGVGPRVAQEFTGVVERLREVSEAAPSARAVVDNDGIWTYSETVIAADKVARSTTGANLVAILASPGRHFVGGVLGVLGAGAAFVPLDVNAPLARISSLLGSCRADCLLVDNAWRPLAEQVLASLETGSQPRVVVIEQSLAAVYEDGLQPVLGSPDDTAYVLFTSGTTGHPKGAMVHRAGLVNHLAAKQDILALTVEDCVIQNAPVTFDVSIWQMLMPLMFGACVRVVSTQDAGDPDRLADVVHSDGVTVLEVVPSLLKAALDLWGSSQPLAGLTTLMVTGEVLPVDLAGRWVAISPHIPLVNAYGPTECSDDVAHAMIGPTTTIGRRTPIGAAIRNTVLRVLGPDLSSLPAGAVGELYISGECVGRGYLWDSVKTANVFVADPWSTSGATMYRTGDRVRWSSEHQLEFIERLDHQVKIRGQRIELGEIEVALRRIAGVTDAVVAARKNAVGHSHLDAYISGATDLARIRYALTEVLPAHMVPSRWTSCTPLPLTAHGKVDRRALEAIDASASSAAVPASAAAAGVAPVVAAPEAVELVRQAFAEVLGSPGITADDSFFGAGGDSVSAIQVVGILRRSGLTVTPRDVFTQGSARAVAHAHKKALPAAGRGVRKIVIEPTPIAVELARQVGAVAGPVSSYAQFVVLTTPDRIGEADVSDLMDHIVDAHPALRLVTSGIGKGVWSHHVPKVGTSRISAQVTTADSEVACADTVVAACSRLDPSRGVMWQAVLLPVDRLLLVVHHLAVDGVSWRILREDLKIAWTARTAGTDIEITSEATSFAEFVELQGSIARRGELAAAEFPHWSEVSAQPGEGPAAKLDPVRHTWGNASRSTLALSETITSRLLTRSPDDYRANINDLLLASLAVAAVRVGADYASVLEVEGHGREELPNAGRYLDVSQTVGWFTSAFPVRLPVTTSVASAVKTVHQQLLSVAAHGIGFGMIRHQHPQGHALLGDRPTPSFGFNYFGRFDISSQSDAWSFVSLSETDIVGGLGVIGTNTDVNMPMRHAVAVTVAVEDTAHGPRLIAEWLWTPDLLAGADIEELATVWFDVIGELVTAGPDAGNRMLTPVDVPLVTVTENDIVSISAQASASLVEEILPLTHIQRGMLFQNQFDHEIDPYVLQVSADLIGDFDNHRFECSLNSVIAENPLLAAQFTYTAAGEPVQVLRRDRTVSVTVDAQVSPETMAQHDRERRFDLGSGPPIRCSIVDMNGDRRRLILSIHHIVVDGWSMPLLISDLLAHYRGERVQPRPTAARYLGWCQQHDDDDALAVWRSALVGASGPTLIARSAANRAVESSGAESVTTTIDTDSVRKLTLWASQHHVTLSSVVQVAWGAMLAEATNAADVIFGAIISTRPAELDGVEAMIGMFLSTVPVRVGRRQSETAAQLVSRVQTEQIDIRAHGHISLGRAISGHPTLAGVAEPFDTVVVFENFPTRDLEGEVAPGLRLERAEATDGRHFPLSLVVQPGHEMHLRFDYLSQRLSREQVVALIETFLRALDQLAEGSVPESLIAVVDQSATVSAVAQPFRSPTSGLEIDICAAFASTLGHEHISLDDNFFVLGGDSISAIHLAGVLRATGVAASPQDIFELRTPAALAGLGRTAPTERSSQPDLPTHTPEELDELDAELGF